MNRAARIIFGVSSGLTIALTIGAYIGGNYAMTEGSAAINMAFNTSNMREVVDNTADPVLKYRSKYDWMKEESKYEKETAELLYEEDCRSIENGVREGAVLLWNKEATLPLRGDEAVSLLSHSSVDVVENGSGSGWVEQKSMDGEKTSVTMKDAFSSRGMDVNDTLWNFYVNGAAKGYNRTDPNGQCTEWRIWSVNEAPWSVYTDEVKNSFATYGDVAFIVLSRTGGEYSDLHFNYENANDFTGRNDKGQSENTSANGGYLGLTDQEDELFSHVMELRDDGTFDKVVLLLNTPNPIMFQDIAPYYEGIDAAMWIGQPGSSGLNAVADLLIGVDEDGKDAVPSGHLSDTFLYDLNSAPSSENDGNYRYAGSLSGLPQNNNFYNTYMVYQEGIYVGYRYYETRYEDQVYGRYHATSSKGAKHSGTKWDYRDEVAFPFGYGDSYTHFEYSGFSVNEKDTSYEVKVTVTNKGDYDGKEVVQVYLQKPYTTYDINFGIEKSAVELAGFAKTKTLAKRGGSQEVIISIPKESFKTYDAEGKETYIVEAGDYYLGLGTDAHNAINNILKAKDVNNGLEDNLFEDYSRHNEPALGPSFVKKLTLAQDDVTYSKSTQTGAKITNQFNDGDINKYRYAGDNEVTYLSRSDYEATYPETPVLEMNADMAHDLAPTTIPDDSDYEMPSYGVYASGSKNGSPDIDHGDLTAKDFIDAPLFPELYADDTSIYKEDLTYSEYWEEKWNQLLDQMTFEEQALMSANAYHQINGAQSIAMPSTRQENGPVGITKRGDFAVPDGNIHYYRFVSYPCAGLLASSFNNEASEDIGQHKSEDMFYLGYNGIYGPGVNMHRTPFGGRAFEYPSEDPFLAGTIEFHESRGIESMGCLAYAKHFALNDTETNRRHVGVWSNEQATREIYLRAFELTFAEGGAHATMNSFSRVGTKWNGGCAAMMTEVLRKEWGWDGVNITDWMSGGPMDYVDAIMAGTNSFDGNGTAANYAPYRNNKAICQKLRESAKVIIHNVVRTNAFNNLTAVRRVFAITPWWVAAIEAIEHGTLALAITMTALFVLSMVDMVLKKKGVLSSPVSGGKNHD